MRSGLYSVRGSRDVREVSPVNLISLGYGELSRLNKYGSLRGSFPVCWITHIQT